MTLTPVFATNAANYSSREPYITAAEYQASPTGVDVANLVPNGSVSDNLDALNQTIRRASSWADTICNQILAATTQTEGGNYRIQAGMVNIPLNQTPLIAVTAMSLGSEISTLNALTDSTNWDLNSTKVIKIPASGLLANAQSCYGQITYIAGYANSFLTADCTTGSPTISVDNSLGVAPGQTITIHDPGQTEQLTVLSTTTTTITFTSNPLSVHKKGTNVSAFPDGIKGAVVLLTTVLIQTRGADAFVMQSTRQTPSNTQGVDPGSARQLKAAMDMLADYAVVFI